MSEGLHPSARIFRVRAELVGLRRELRVHVLCECGRGAWICAVAPFPELFFDHRPLVGRAVGEALASLAARYAGFRALVEIGSGISDRAPARGGSRAASRKERTAASKEPAAAGEEGRGAGAPLRKTRAQARAQARTPGRGGTRRGRAAADPRQAEMPIR